MRLDNLLREKIYAFAKNTVPSEAEKQIASQILQKEKLGSVLSLETVDNNDNYDSYLVLTESGRFCLKTSLDESYLGLKNDAIAVQKTSEKRVFCGELKNWNIQYSIQPFKNGQSLQEMGKSLVLDKKFIAALKKIHKQSSERKLSEFLNKYFIKPDFIKSIDFSSQPEIEQICNQELDVLSGEIKELYQSWMSEGGLIHSGITPSRVLIWGDEFSLINFDDSCEGNPLFDLLSLKYEFFFNDFVENEMLKLYFEQGLPSKERLFQAKETIKRIKFFDLIIEFLKQVYVYRNAKPHKILQFTEKMSKTFVNFSDLPSFERHRGKIVEMFTHSVI